MQLQFCTYFAYKFATRICTQIADILLRNSLPPNLQKAWQFVLHVLYLWTVDMNVYPVSSIVILFLILFSPTCASPLSYLSYRFPIFAARPLWLYSTYDRSVAAPARCEMVYHGPGPCPARSGGPPGAHAQRGQKIGR